MKTASNRWRRPAAPPRRSGALPDCDERDLYWAYLFLSGALTLTFAEAGRIDNAKRPARRKTKR